MIFVHGFGLLSFFRPNIAQNSKFEGKSCEIQTKGHNFQVKSSVLPRFLRMEKIVVIREIRHLLLGN